MAAATADTGPEVERVASMGVHAHVMCMVCRRGLTPGTVHGAVPLCTVCQMILERDAYSGYWLSRSMALQDYARMTSRLLPCSSEITCVLCGTVGAKRFVDANNRTLACGCDVCADCFTSWCVAKVDDMCAVIRCPLGSRAVSSKRACTEPVSQDAVQFALKEKPQHKRKYLMIKTDLLHDPYVKSCPGCGAITAQTGRTGEITCQECQLAWCFGCHAPAHPSLSCADFELSRSHVEQLQTKWSRKHTKACPKCTVAIQRNDGCNHIHCTLCDTHFCYACGMALEDGDTAPYYHKLVCTKRHRYEGLKTVAIVITLPLTVPACLLLLGGMGIYAGAQSMVTAVKKSHEKRKEKKRRKREAAANAEAEQPSADIPATIQA